MILNGLHYGDMRHHRTIPEVLISYIATLGGIIFFIALVACAFTPVNWLVGRLIEYILVW